MDIPKLPPLPAVPAASRPGVPGDRTAQAASAPKPPTDGFGFKPLDLASALKILISEVNLALIDLRRSAAAPASVVPPDFAMTVEDAVPQAARVLVELLLRDVPAQDMPAESLDQAVATLRNTITVASQSAIERVSQWRDTPASMADALRQVQALAAGAMAGEIPAGILMRPEWLGLAPRLAQLRRRLRRRTLWLSESDADHVATELKPDPEAGEN